jgi:putative peptidoglycan lipid II flippase
MTSWWRAVGSVSGGTLCSRLLGYGREIAVAHWLGTGPLAEAYFVAFRLPNLFRSLFAEGAFSAAFVPLYTEMRQSSPQDALRFARMSWLAMACIAWSFVVLADSSMVWVAGWLAPGLMHGESAGLVVTLCRITMPYLGCIALVAMLASLCYAHRRFWVGAFAPALLNLSILGALVVHSMDWLRPWALTAAHAAALGIVVGGVLQLAALGVAAWPLLGRPWPHERPSPKDWHGLRCLGKRMVPGLIGSASLQINVVINTMLASWIAGAVAVLSYADRLMQLPLSLIGTALGTILLPEVSRRWASKDWEGALRWHHEAMLWAMLFTLPASVGFGVLSEPVIRLIFEHGAFDAKATVATAEVLAILGCGLPGFVLVKLFLPLFFARHDTRTPFVITLITVAVNVGWNLAMTPSMGVVALAVGSVVSAWVNAGLLIAVLMFRGWWSAGGSLGWPLGWLVLCNGILGVLLHRIEVTSSLAWMLSVGGTGAIFVGVAAIPLVRRNWAIKKQ